MFIVKLVIGRYMASGNLELETENFGNVNGNIFLNHALTLLVIGKSHHNIPFQIMHSCAFVFSVSTYYASKPPFL